MVGLVVTSSTEVSFNARGFTAAIGAICLECMSNVVSKKVLERLSPAKLQLFTGLFALIIQLPLVLFTLEHHAEFRHPQ